MRNNSLGTNQKGTILSGISLVYCPTTEQVEELHAAAKRDGLQSGYYHGQLPADERRVEQQKFSSGTIKIMFATNAFGMGIDRPDIRQVIHMASPSSLDAFAQEVGRAGRDGEPSRAVLLTCEADFDLQRQMVLNANPDVALIRQVYNGLCRSLSSDSLQRSCPIIKLNQTTLRKIGGTDLNKMYEVLGALRVCERLGYVALYGETLVALLIPPHKLPAGGLVTDEGEIARHLARDMYRLQEMREYARMEIGSWQPIEKYFGASEVPQAYLDRSYGVNHDTVTFALLTPLLKKDYSRKSYLDSGPHLCFPQNAEQARPTKKAFENELSRVERRGLLKTIRHKRLNVQLIALTAKGVAALAEAGEEGENLNTADSIFACCFSPLGAQALRGAISPWVNRRLSRLAEVAGCQPDLVDFGYSHFTVGDEDITGFIIAARYFRSECASQETSLVADFLVSLMPDRIQAQDSYSDERELVLRRHRAHKQNLLRQESEED